MTNEELRALMEVMVLAPPRPFKPTMADQLAPLIGGVDRATGPDKSGYAIFRSPEPYVSREDILTAAREQGAREERQRLMALIETCRPTEQPYTRLEWRYEERGKRDLWDKIMRAVGGIA